MKILIAEDEDHIRDGLQEILEGEGYTVVTARNGHEALERLATDTPDMALLDIMMPEVDGYEVCRRALQRRPDLPVIFISAKSEEIDRVVGLELGADDFIRKPFGVREVIARIRAVTRRTLRARQADSEPADGPDAVFTMGDLTVHPTELRARRGDETIDLSLRDVCILRTLYRARGHVVDRDTLFDACWGMHYLPSSRTLDQHISKLRKRIERDPKNPTLIRTVHGVGYRFEEDGLTGDTFPLA